LKAPVQKKVTPPPAPVMKPVVEATEEASEEAALANEAE